MQKLSNTFTLPLAFILLLLGACQVVDTSAPETAASPDPIAATTPEPQPEVEVEVEIEYGSFTEEQLYQAIISEIGAQRGDMVEAGENYFDLAFDTRDLAIIQRAVQFASYNEDTNAMLQLGLLWAEVSPDDPQPHLMLSFSFLESGRFDQALSHMSDVIELGGDMDFSALSSRTGRLDRNARAALINNMRTLVERYPANTSMQIALAQLLAQNSQFPAALEVLESIRDQDAFTAGLVLLEAQLYQSMDEPDTAMRVMRDGVREFPADDGLRRNYAGMLIQDEDYAAAQAQFAILMEGDPQDWETYYSMGLLALEMEDYKQAIEIFSRLVNVDQRVDESQYYIAYAHEQTGDLGRAIESYRQVRVGTENFLAAQQQATRLSISLGELADAHEWLNRLSRGQPRLEILFTTIESSLLIQNDYGDEAKALLDRALNKYPNETDLLFARVLYYDSISDRAGSERDLRQIITMQPDDSRALNHLGYMLADQTERYEEALDLIERAIAVSPDDPAIIDSLGWAQYKLGNYEDALRNLRRAFASFPDHEVASHIGEVLWMMGREEEAVQVWENALETRPDSELIKAVMDRFLND